MLLYHHSRPLKGVRFGIVRSRPSHHRGEFRIFRQAYLWLERECGFYPLFLAVGTSLEDVYLTGYDDNFRRLLSRKVDGSGILRKKGQFPNHVLFSFETIPGGIFLDFNAWHIILNKNPEEVTQREKSWVFKPSWSASKWVRKARQDPGSVQVIVPQIDLRTASRVWVRNRATGRYLETLGFTNIQIQRIPVPELP